MLLRRGRNPGPEFRGTEESQARGKCREEEEVASRPCTPPGTLVSGQGEETDSCLSGPLHPHAPGHSPAMGVRTAQPAPARLVRRALWGPCPALGALACGCPTGWSGPGCPPTPRASLSPKQQQPGFPGGCSHIGALQWLLGCSAGEEAEGCRALPTPEPPRIAAAGSHHEPTCTLPTCTLPTCSLHARAPSFNPPWTSTGGNCHHHLLLFR